MLMYYVQKALDNIEKVYFVELYKADGTEKTYDEVKTEAKDIALFYQTMLTKNSSKHIIK